MGSWRVIGATSVAGLLIGITLSPPADASDAPGHVVIIQAVPKDAVDITLDGKQVHRNTPVGDVLGPLSVEPGRHRIGFTDASGDIGLTSTVQVASGSSRDIVVHLPASVGGSPVVNSYKTPRGAIAPGKARVLIAHTATVAPADVRVDGVVVFKDIANGEFATADIAAGDHTVALLPAGLRKHPILGPLHVDLKAGTVTMVYAYGNPRDHSMNVIAHTARLASNGAVVPATIDTGRAGLAASLVVHPFRVAPTPPTSGRASDGRAVSMWGAGAVAVVLVAVAVWRRRSRVPIRPG
jgi:hypothetical protein